MAEEDFIDVATPASYSYPYPYYYCYYYHNCTVNSPLTLHYLAFTIAILILSPFPFPFPSPSSSSSSQSPQTTVQTTNFENSLPRPFPSFFFFFSCPHPSSSRPFSLFPLLMNRFADRSSLKYARRLVAHHLSTFPSRHLPPAFIFLGKLSSFVFFVFFWVRVFLGVYSVCWRMGEGRGIDTKKGRNPLTPPPLP